MATGKLRVATCQFAVGKSIRRNGARIGEFLARARKGRVDVVHFSECALSGYAGVDMRSTDEIDWELLCEETKKIMERAEQLGLWVILGSSHRLTGRHKPHSGL